MGRVIARLRTALETRGETLRGSRILVLGLAYKKDVSDPRESPAFEILWQLQQMGAEVCYYDPYIPVPPSMRTWQDLDLADSVELTADVLQAQDAVIVVTDHTDVDYAAVLEHARMIVDTRGVFRGDNPKVVRA